MRQVTQKVIKTVFLCLVTVMMLLSCLQLNGITTVNAEAGDVPDHSKILTDNKDGTYTIEMTVTGDADTETTTTVNKSNVVLVIDTSGSMANPATDEYNTYTYNASTYDSNTYYYGRTNSGTYVRLGRNNNQWYRTDNNNYYYGTVYTPAVTRLDAAKAAACDLVDNLLANNKDETLNGVSLRDIVEISVVSFAGVRGNYNGVNHGVIDTYDGSHTDGTAIKNWINSLNQVGGTNWERALSTALSEANEYSSQTGETTSVIFLTDGMPTFYGNDSGTGQETADNVHSCWNNADDDARAIVNAGYTLYNIFAFGADSTGFNNDNNRTPSDYLKSLTNYAYRGTGTYANTESTDYTRKYFFDAKDTSALEAAFTAIINNISNTLGIAEVGIADGTTSHVSAGAGVAVDIVDADTNSDKYWMRWNVNNDGTFDMTINNVTKRYTATQSGENVVITWTDGETTKTVTYKGSISNGRVKIQWESATDFYNVAPPKADFTEDSVDWDLSSAGILLDNVTYSYSFTVYPSQYTLDLIADLKNGNIQYEDLPGDVGQYIVDNGGGSYSFRTNTTATLSYNDTRTDNGPQSTTFTPPQPQKADAQEMDLKKLWAGSYKLSDGTYEEQKPVEFSILRDNVAVDTITLVYNEDPELSYTGSIFIANGLMTVDKENKTVDVKVQGHDYQLQEPVGLTYHWELDADILHPMIVNGNQEMLRRLETNEIPEGMGSDAYYTDGTNEYYKIGSYTYVSSGSNAALTATNIRRSNLNLTKAVQGKDAPADALFTFNVTVNSANGLDGKPEDLWFSVYDPVEDTTVYPIPGISGATPETGDTGYYYVTSGTTFTVQMEAGWNLRFTNVLTGTTYTMEETTLPTGFEFVKVECNIDEEGTEQDPVVDGQSISGTVVQGDTSYVVTYTNKFEFATVAPEVTKVLSVPEGITGPADITGWYTFTLKLADGGSMRIAADEDVVAELNKITSAPYTYDGITYTKISDTLYYYTATELTVKNPSATGGTAIFSKLLYDEAGTYTYTVTEAKSADKAADAAKITDDAEATSGKTITVTVTEAEDGSLTASATSATFTNTYEPETIDVVVKKVWDDKENQDGIRPSSVEVTLTGSNNYSDSQTLSATNNWTYTWEDLLKYASYADEVAGTAITYSLSETTTTVITGTDTATTYSLAVTGDAATGFTVTNTHTPEETEVSVEKVWEDADNQDGIRPSSVKVQLYADDQEYGDPVTLDASNEWKYTWEELAKNNAGTAIVYTVDEVTDKVITGADGVGTYSYTVTGSQAAGYKVTNKHTPEVRDISVEKVWEDENNQDGIRPDSVQVTLYVGETAYTGENATVTLSETNEWTYTWEGLDKYADGTEIQYTVKEVETAVITGTDTAGQYDYEVSGDMETGFTVTNTHTPEETEATVKKVWDDAENQDGKRPTSLIVSLSDGQTVTLNEANEWSGTITGLPKYANGTEIVYTWTEEALPEGYTLTNTAKEGTVTTLTNSYAPEKTTVTVTKAWEDADNQDGIRPASVQVQLLADGEKFGDPVTLDASVNWTYTWTNLDKMSAGTAIAYTVEEVKTSVITGTDGVGTYAIEVTGSQTDGYTVTNTHTPEVTTVTVTKEWVDGNNQDAIRPDSVTINLLADGKAFGGTTTLPASVTLNADNTWTYTWEGLPKYAGTTKAIEYTVEEVKTAVITGTDGPGTYAIAITGSQAEGFTVTNTHTPEVVTVKVTKSWADGDNQDAIRPDSVTINLLADGKAYTGTPASATLDEDGNWTYTWTGLPKYAGTTTAVVYTVEEVKTDVITGTDGPGTYAISITGSQADGFTVTNTHTPELTERTVTKVWDDADNQDGIRPETLTVTLKNGDTVVGTVTLSEENEWTGTIDNLPKYAGTTTEINYVWEETVPTDYTKTSQTTEGTVTTITNSHTPAETTVTVTKVWDDADNQDAIRPESVTINLLADGVAFEGTETLPASVTLNADNSWTYTWEGLPKYAGSTTAIVYTVTETETSVITGTDGVGTYAYKIEGDQSKGYTVTNTHTPELTEITVTKIWDDASNQDGKRPDSVKYQIYADGVAVTGDLATVLVSKPDGDAVDTWTATVKGLPKYNKSTTPIVYTIKELNADGEVIAEGGALDENYTVSYGEDGLTATNKHTPEQTQRTVVKVWDDNDNQDGFRTESLDVQLLADGEVYETVTLNDENEWTVTVDELDVYKAGKEIVYSWAEQLPTDVDYSMTSSVETTDEELGKVTTITNKHTPEETSVPVTKVWDDAEDQDGLRPESIKVQLMVGEDKIGDPVELSEENDWSYIWTELDKRADGEIIKYEVVEVEVPEGYEVTIENTAAEGSFSYTVTNTHEPELTEVPVTKEWDDAEDQDGIRPESIIAVLVKDGVDYMEIELNEENEWTYTWKELDKYRDHGTEIVYTVKEKATPEGYEASVEGNTITNTHTPEEVEVSVEKVWDDADNQDGIRPEKIKVNLLADGEVIDSYELVEAEEWKHTFSELPKYKIENGKGGIEIKYTVEEAEVPEGYEMTQEGNTITNTHTPEEVSVTVEKVWEDDENNDGFRPESITVYLTADGEKIRQLTLSEENDWTETVEGLPKFKVGAVGKEVEYKFEEDPVAEYEVTYSDINEGKIVITNTHENELIDIPVEKVWVGDEDFQVIRPEKITVVLLADGKEAGTAELSYDNEWKYTFEELEKYADGKEIAYTVKEVEVPAGYKSEITGSKEDGYKVTNTFTPIHFDPPVMKTVKGDEANSSDTFTFQFEGLDGAPMPEGAEGQIMTATLKAGEEHEFGNVYLIEPGTYQYKITEVNDGKEGYTYDETEYLLVFEITTDENNQLVVNLTINGEEADYQNLTPSQFEFVNEYREYVDVEVEKIWDDKDNAEGKRPEEIKVTLYANNEAVETVTLNEENGWTYKWEGLAFSDEEYEEISYTVKEDEVPEGYTMSFSQTGYKVTITNTVNPPETGDTNNLKLWATLMALSMTSSVALAGVALKRRKEDELF